MFTLFDTVEEAFGFFESAADDPAELESTTATFSRGP